MTADELRALQAPLKARYREDPSSARHVLRARARLGLVQPSCEVDTHVGPVTAGLHPATGGDGTLACSGDMLLQALVACAGVTMTSVATAIGVPLRGGAVFADGDIDFRGTLGVARDAPVGFTGVRLRFELDTDASDEQLATLLRLTERYCVVFQTLRVPPHVTVTHTRA